MEDNYEREFLMEASKFDKLVDGCGEIKKNALEIVKKNDDGSIKDLINKVANAVLSNKKINQMAESLKNSLVLYCGYTRIKSACDNGILQIEDNRTLEELIHDLNMLVGLNKVKEKVNDLIAYQIVRKARLERGYFNEKSTLHMAFIGNPGTGKTTVARIIGHMYKKLGLLSKGQFIEVSRTDLIAGYQGQTALKVKNVIQKARGGVLFIDEAYSITENDHTDSYGRECLTELTKALEDYREDLVVIVAGYSEPMSLFFESNPGLKSRINIFIKFDNYTSNELIAILESMCKKNYYKLEESLKNELVEYFNDKIKKNETNFANGRLARNIFDDLVMNHAKRVARISNPTDEELVLLKKEDFIIK